MRNLMLAVSLIATCFLFASNSYGQCGVRYSQYVGPSYGYYGPVHRSNYGYGPVYVVRSNVVYSSPVYSSCNTVVPQQVNQNSYAPKKEAVKEPASEKKPVMPSPNYNQEKPTPKVEKSPSPTVEKEEIIEPRKVESPSPFIDVPAGKPTIHNNFVQNKKFN